MIIKGKARRVRHLTIWSKMVPTAAMWPHSWRRDTLQSANILQQKFTSLNLENIIVIYTIMTIKGKACCAGHLAIWSKMVPTAAMWPHSWRRDTLQSANILLNKFTSLNLENIIVIYTIMTIKGKAHRAGHLTIWSKR